MDRTKSWRDDLQVAVLLMMSGAIANRVAHALPIGLGVIQRFKVLFDRG